MHIRQWWTSGSRSARALRVTGIYALLSSIWIFASDRLLGFLVKDPAQMTLIATYKGWFFVVVTACILYALIVSVSAPIADFSRFLDDSAKSDLPDEGAENSRSPGILWPFLAFAMICIATTGAGILLYRSQLQENLRAQEEELSIVVNLKTDQVNEWIENRIHDARYATERSYLSREITHWIANGQPLGPVHDAILARLDQLKKRGHFESIMVLDPHGIPRLPTDTLPLQNSVRPLALQSIRSGELSLFVPPMETPGMPVLDIIAPLSNPDGTSQKNQGALLLTFDSQQVLLPLLSRWPTPNPHAELLILNTAGGLIRDLHIDESGLPSAPVGGKNLRTPLLLTPSQLPMDRGVTKGIDEQGKQVIGAFCRTRHLPWILVAKRNLDDIYRPIHGLLGPLISITLLLVFVSGLLLRAWWKQQVTRHQLQRQRDSLARRVLQEHLELLSKNAHDAIILFDQNGQIIDANARAETFYRRTRDELLGLNVQSLRPSQALTTLNEHWNSIETQGYLNFETTHIRSDGSTFPVEVTSSLFRIGNELFRQSIIRDITERKVHEMELEKARDYYFSVLDELPNPIWRTSPEGHTIYVNQAWLEFTGRPLEAELGDNLWPIVHPEDRQRVFEAYRQSTLTRSPLALEYRVLHKDGSYHTISDYGRPLCARGEYQGFVGSIYDLQSQRETEQDLVRIKDLYSALSQTNQAIIHAKQSETLFQDICDIGIRHGKFILACIVSLDEQAKAIHLESSAGPALGYLNEFSVTLDPMDPRSRGPVASCFLKQRSQIVNDFLNDPTTLPWHEQAQKHGVRANAAFPLFQDGNIVAVLSLYSDQADFFETDRVALLEEMAEDVSFALDRFQAEVRHQQSEARNRETLKRLQDIETAVDESANVLITDQSGVLIYVNHRTANISGYDRSELIGKKPSILGSDYHSSDYYKDLWEIITAGGIWRGEFRNRNKQGQIYWLDTTIVPFLDERGTPFQFMAICFDITDRKLAEDKLMTISADRMSLLDAASVAKVVPWSLNLNSESLRMGDSSFMVLGRPASTFRARSSSLKELLKPQDHKLFNHAQSEAKAGRTGSFEAPIKRGENQVVWTRWTLAYREGFLHGVIQDITEQHDLHAQLLQSQKLESLGTLVGGITHDFNNILMGILGYTEVLSLTPNLSVPMKKGLDVISRAAERGRGLVNQLLNFSRRSVASKSLANLNDTLREVKSLMQLPGDNRIELQLEPDEGLPETLMDASQIHQVAMNLAVNARDAILGQGKISFRTGTTTLEAQQAVGLDKRPGPYVYFEVEDTGIGIPEDKLPRIFEPFYTTKGVGKGTGLGLSMAHGVVESHGGILQCESQVGVGTRFRVLLPLLTSESLEEEPEMVEMIPTAAELLTYMGHSVIKENNLERALEAHRETPFQLIIANLEMDGGKGLEHLIALQNELPDIPTLAGSAHPNPNLKGLKRPPHAIVHWPFRSVELLSAIQRTLS